MKGRKIITLLIIVNLILIAIIYTLIGKENVNNKKQIIKEMTEIEYEDNITSLNTSHDEYVKSIEESKIKLANAITEMGVKTSKDETLENMANNIKSINKDESLLNFETFTGKAWRNGNNGEGASIPTITYNDNNITFTSKAYQQGVSVYPIDLTDIDSICIRVESYSNADYTLFGFCDNSDTFSNDRILYGSTAGGVNPSETLSFDTRNYTGIKNFFIRTVGARSTDSSITLSKFGYKLKWKQ